jgi:cellulose synthase/poly-beta-1,6-N-acetylglucosamine synthase-like glycosyltransferase
VAIVTDNEQDPAYEIAKSIAARYPAKAALYTAEPEAGAGGKVAALLTAIEKTAGEAEVYAFVDSDSLVPLSWLRNIVDPLLDRSIGASTGFRWYIPSTGGFWSHVEAAWNASGTNLMFNPRYNFPWGGAIAIRAETLQETGIRRVWSNAVSDDMTLNSALRAHGYRIIFLPQCTAAAERGKEERSIVRRPAGSLNPVQELRRPAPRLFLHN